MANAETRATRATRAMMMDLPAFIGEPAGHGPWEIPVGEGWTWVTDRHVVAPLSEYHCRKHEEVVAGNEVPIYTAPAARGALVEGGRALAALDIEVHELRSKHVSVRGGRVVYGRVSTFADLSRQYPTSGYCVRCDAPVSYGMLDVQGRWDCCARYPNAYTASPPEPRGVHVQLSGEWESTRWGGRSAAGGVYFATTWDIRRCSEVPRGSTVVICGQAA